MCVIYARKHAAIFHTIIRSHTRLPFPSLFFIIIIYLNNVRTHKHKFIVLMYLIQSLCLWCASNIFRMYKRKKEATKLVLVPPCHKKKE